MFNFNKLTAAILFSSALVGFSAMASGTSDPATAPDGPFDPSGISRYAEEIGKYSTDAESNADAKADNKYPGFDTLPWFDLETLYNLSGTKVKYTDGDRTGVFISKWYIVGEAPDFDSANGAWKLDARTTAEGQYLSEAESVGDWDPLVAYVAGDKVKYVIGGKVHYFEARGWVQGEVPILLQPGDPAWMSTWVEIPGLSGDVVVPDVEAPDADVTPPVDPTPPPPPVLPVPPPVEPPSPPPVLPEVGENNLPAEGYAFLREITLEEWDWFFPLRSGRYNAVGGERNLPPFAEKDGSKDKLTLDAFKSAVVEYNAWASSKGLKTFLNEGSKSQQASEFTTFWAKSARETSGTWANAPAPWIVEDADAGTVWKGALYWIEEMNRTTNDQGISPVIEYVDAGSEYTPAPGRSYYGRGPIQLSWNYNYGAFSAWLYDNGMMRDVITARDTLLLRPDYVAINGEVSVMSAVWFWMTPQGAKPSSHDVMFGDVTNVSQSSQEQGLPPRNDGGEIRVAAGESLDQAVVAYRLGTVINIVNGGLECNKAASWHDGPMQRVSYYNAFGKYLNAQVEGITVPIIDAATNVWNINVTEQSPDNLKTATCYAQKSYYTW